MNTSTLNSVVVPLPSETKAPDAANDNLIVRAFAIEADTKTSLNDLFELLGNTRVDIEMISADERVQIAPDALPNVLIVELGDDTHANDKAVTHYKALIAGTECGLVAVSRNLSQADILKYMRAGIDDFLPYPFDQDETAQVLSRFAGRTGKAGVTGDDKKVISFFHASGGVGTTTIAVNTAISLYRQVKDAGKKVALLDFDIQFGDVALQMDINQTSPVLDLLNNPERLDDALLQAMMVKVSTGLDILTTPEMPVPHSAFDKDLIAKIIKTARQSYDYVIIDLPQCLTTWTDNIIQQSTDIFVVTKLEVPALRQTARLLDTFEHEGISTQKFKIIVNESSGTGLLKNAEDVDLRQAEKSLKRKIEYIVPSSPSLMRDAQNLGKPPVLIKSKGPFAKSISKLTHSLKNADARQDAKVARS